MSHHINSHHVSQTQYADDTQLFIALSPSNPLISVSNLSACLGALHLWFCHNGMALNPDKSEAVIIGTRQRSSSYSSISSIDIAGTSVPFSDYIKLLGVTLDRYMTLEKHVNSVCSSCYYHIRALRHIRPAITEDMAKSVAYSLVCSRLDYANSALTGIAHKHLARLERVQNALARVIAGSPTSYCLHSSMLANLHWLPIEHRINFKLAMVTFNTLRSGQPTYLRTLLNSYTPARNLRSSNTNLLTVPPVRTVFGSRGFSVAAPTVWNSLPADIRTCTSPVTFRRLLKTHFYLKAFNSH